MAQPLETYPSSDAGEITAPHLDGEYTAVHTLDEERISQFRTKFGDVALHTLQVEVVREYEDRRPRTTWYEVKAAYRTDSDAPDQSKYPVVGYDNALLTTPRVPNTATNRYFLNPIYEGFSGIGVGVKQKPIKTPFDLAHRLVPHQIPLEEIADDGLVVVNHVADEMGLGQQPGIDGIRHINKNGYSRGVQIGIVQAARAGLHAMAVDRLQGRGPGPINEVAHMKVGGSIKKEGKAEGGVILNQILHEPHHAINNYLNVLTHRPYEIISYVGDAGSLLHGGVARAMPYINPDLRGYVGIYSNDPFGRHKDYVAHFDEYEEMMEENTYYSRIAPGFRLIHRQGAHMSGMDKAEVKFDRVEWQAERKYLDGLTNSITSYNAQ